MGEMRRSIPAGVWKVELVGVDIAGNLPSAEDAAQMTGSAGPFELQLDGPESIVEVVVPPRPQCGDRIDNDRNGLVDGDDPSCVQGAEGLRM